MWNTIITILIGTILSIYLFYKWTMRKYLYFEKIGVPYLKPTFLLGNTGGFFFKRYRIDEFLMHLYNSFPNEKVYGMFAFVGPIVVIRNPEQLKQMTIKDFDYFINHRTALEDNTDVLFGKSLFMLKDEKWRDMRATLSPAFTGSKMRQMFEYVIECADQMSKHFISEINKISNTTNSIDVEMKDIFTRYTTDVIGTCAFGIKVNSFENKNNEFYLNGKQIANLTTPKRLIRLLCISLFPSVMRLLDIQLIDADDAKKFKAMVLDTIDVRDKNNILRPDMINILMKIRKGFQIENEIHNANSKVIDSFSSVDESIISQTKVIRKWTDDEIVAQSFLFFAAGFETTSTVLSYLTYALAIYPDVQERLYKEICETNACLINGEKISYENIHKMEYLDMVVSESLRVYPPAPLTDRLCTKDYQYDDGKIKFLIKKGTPVWIPIYGYHHDPKYFPNPHLFDPERFNNQNKHNINLSAYIPFGIGPRNCIGSRFALMEIKAVVYYLLLNFQFEPNDSTQIPMRFSTSPIGLVPEKPIYVNMKRRITH